MLLLRPQPRPVVGVAPVVIGGTVVVVFGALAVLAEKIQREQRQINLWMDQRATNRAVRVEFDYRRATRQQLDRLEDYLNWRGTDQQQLPFSGVMIERRQINTERMRRAGKLPLAFIEPQADLSEKVLLVGLAGLVAVGEALTGLGAWLFQWGAINSRRGGKYGPPVPPVPEWWPTGSFSPTGANEISWEVTRVFFNNPTDCEILTNTFEIPFLPAANGMQRINVRPVGDPPAGAGCNVQPPRSVQIEYEDRDGVTQVMGGQVSDPYVVALRIRKVKVRPAYGAPGLPYPAGAPAAVKDPFYKPEKLPQIRPQVVPEPAPLPEPSQLPGTEPLPQPQPAEPAKVPKAPPLTAPGVAPTIPKAPPEVGIGVDAKPQAPPKEQPKPTPPGQLVPWPGANPIGQPGTEPRPDLPGIAKVVGQIEQKLDQMNTPRIELPGGGGFDWADALGRLWELFAAATDGGSYKVWSPCLPDGEAGSASNPMEESWSGSIGEWQTLQKRMDALARLIQDAKVLPQPICRRPSTTGEWVSIQFESDETPAGKRDPVIKVFRYLDQNAHQLEAHVDHWRDFSWQAGPVIVVHKGGVWGVPKVWAATAEEGKRVIAHAAQIAGVDLNAPGSAWVVTRSKDARYGWGGTMRVTRGRDRLWRITKRDGPNGPPEFPIPGPDAPDGGIG
jgi:hypothetical protein